MLLLSKLCKASREECVPLRNDGHRDVSVGRSDHGLKGIGSRSEFRCKDNQYLKSRTRNERRRTQGNVVPARRDGREVKSRSMVPADRGLNCAHKRTMSRGMISSSYTLGTAQRRRPGRTKGRCSSRWATIRRSRTSCLPSYRGKSKRLCQR